MPDDAFEQEPATKLAFYITPSFGPQDVIKAGMLMKRSLNDSSMSLLKPKNWKRRLLVLLSTEIHWYDITTEQSTHRGEETLCIERLGGRLQIGEASALVKDADEATGLSYSFSVSTGGRTLTCHAESYEQRRAWLTALQNRISSAATGAKCEAQEQVREQSADTIAALRPLKSRDDASDFSAAFFATLGNAVGSEMLETALRAAIPVLEAEEAAAVASGIALACIEEAAAEAVAEAVAEAAHREAACREAAEACRSIIPVGGQVLFSAELGSPPLPACGGTTAREHVCAGAPKQSLDVQLGSQRDSHARAVPLARKASVVESAGRKRRSSLPGVGLLAARLAFFGQPLRGSRRR